jgi:hypothetical protein
MGHCCGDDGESSGTDVITPGLHEPDTRIICFTTGANIAGASSRLTRFARSALRRSAALFLLSGRIYVPANAR